MRSTAEWRARAREDPYHAVASHPGTEGRRWDVGAFYELGQSDWADFKARWEQYAGGLSGTCLEVGCGAGRITREICNDFEKVIAVDASQDMVELASRVADAEYHLVDDSALPIRSGSVQAVFSCHVFQHFESEHEVVDTLRESCRVLAPGGTIMAHLLVSQSTEKLWRLRLREGRYRLGVRIQPRRGLTIARRYHIDRVRLMFESSGFKQVEMREFRVTSNSDPHPFWFGRKC